METKMGTVYMVRHKPSGKCYVGQTRQEPKRRWREHRKSKKFFSQVLHELGVENFEFVVLDTVPSDKLNEYEAGWIAILGSMVPAGFNRTSGGAGHVMSEATKAKMSRSRKGVIPTRDVVARRLANGKSVEALRRANAARKGKKLPEAHRANIAAAIRKRAATAAVSAETRARISAAQRGRTLTSEHKAAISAGLRGRPANPATSYALGWETRRLKMAEKESLNGHFA